MSRLTRIVCDNPDCMRQVEFYATEYYLTMEGRDDTPEGWFRLSYHEPKQADPTALGYIEAASQPRFFCSVACVQHYDGGITAPRTSRDSVE